MQKTKRSLRAQQGKYQQRDHEETPLERNRAKERTKKKVGREKREKKKERGETKQEEKYSEARDRKSSRRVKSSRAYITAEGPGEGPGVDVPQHRPKSQWPSQGGQRTGPPVALCLSLIVPPPRVFPSSVPPDSSLALRRASTYSKNYALSPPGFNSL